MATSFTVRGQFIDWRSDRIYPVEIQVKDGKISKIIEVAGASDQFILPGFVDAHIHIESSMVVPAEFAKIAVKHGTVATVSDPHEIANVLGKEGVRYMVENGNEVPFNFWFGVPSCVPATPFETAGAVLDQKDVEEMLDWEGIYYLSEMMNWPAVLNNDPLVMDKINAALKRGMPVDGHAPGLRGDTIVAYAKAGITTDHESFELEEAKDKIAVGMKVLIREGSAAKNFEALHPLIAEYSDRLMFCSDDKHPDELLVSHINGVFKRALNLGYDLFRLIEIACVNPVKHYGIDVGLLKVGDSADFIVTTDPRKDFQVKTTFIKGQKVFDNHKTLFETKKAATPNAFSSYHIEKEELQFKGTGHVRVIGAIDGELITKELAATLSKDAEGNVLADTEQDVLKMVVVNRYKKAKPAIAFIKGFGLKEGAIASTVAHDSHNIVAVGVDDKSIARVINQLMDSKGGVAVCDNKQAHTLPLPVAGLMSNEPVEVVGEKYQAIDEKVKLNGSTLSAPFMTLSFMALLVIPDLKLSDLGLFSGKSFSFVDLEKGEIL